MQETERRRQGAGQRILLKARVFSNPQGIIELFRLLMCTAYNAVVYNDPLQLAQKSAIADCGGEGERGKTDAPPSSTKEHARVEEAICSPRKGAPAW